MKIDREGAFAITDTLFSKNEIEFLFVPIDLFRPVLAAFDWGGHFITENSRARISRFIIKT
jgi:hypothetical protein